MKHEQADSSPRHRKKLEALAFSVDSPTKVDSLATTEPLRRKTVQSGSPLMRATPEAPCSASPGASPLMSAKSPMFFTPSGPNNKKVDALRIQPRVEMHRSSSGRNLRLKHITQPRKDALLSPNALTPRAPSEKRPQERVCSFDDSRASTVSSYSSSVSSIEEDAAIVSLVSLSPIESARHPQRSRRKSNQENHDDNKLQKSQHERRCSFSISQQVLHELGLARLPPQPDDHPEDEHEGNQIANPPNPFQVMQQQLDEDSQKQRDGVYQFDLWKKAGRSRALPDAISHAATPQAVSPSHMHMPEKRRSESIDLVPHIERIHAKELTPARASTGSSQTSVINKEPISLTRSTSPTIGSRSHRSASTSSSRKLAPLMPSAEDRTIVRWKRGELIGEGTFGKVYMGLNSDTGGLFALKEIEIRSCPNADQMRQLQKLGEEISLMRNLSHKHIVRYKGSHRTDKFFYIFMEYVPGGSIASMLKQFDAFSEDLIRIFTRQIVEGVRYLHSMGIIHRDIKGANVLVTEQGVPKLADFGCSKQLPQIQTTSLEESLRSIRGSIPWMAPEVVKQTGHGFKADIWSIGATVIEMATAKHPWPTSTNSLSAMYAIATARSPPPLPENLSHEAISFLQRCFCIDPEERATADELLGHSFLADISSR